MDPTLDMLLKQLDNISCRSFRLAREVLEDPSRRKQNGEKARLMKGELYQISDELKAKSPDRYEPKRLDVSESILDLNYAMEETPMVSLRLGQEMRAKKRTGA